MCCASLGHSAPGPCSVQEKSSGHCLPDVSRASPTAVLGTPTHSDPEPVPGVLQGPDKVADVMTKGRLYSARVDTPVDEGNAPLSVRSPLSGPVLLFCCGPCYACDKLTLLWDMCSWGAHGVALLCFPLFPVSCPYLSVLSCCGLWPLPRM